MSAVKNLRAMFENKGDASPPEDDRGRSLGVSTPSPTPGAAVALNGSPRPLSKVRTSFVVVAKDGRMGIARENSNDSRASSARRVSDELDNETVSTTIEKATMPPESIDNISNALGKLSVEDAPPVVVAEVKGALTDKPSRNPDHVVDQETPIGAMTPDEPTTAKPKAEKTEKPIPKTEPDVSTTKTEAPKPINAKSTTPPATAKTATKTVSAKAAPVKTVAAKTTVKSVPKVSTPKTTSEAVKKTATKAAPKATESSAIKRDPVKTATTPKPKVGTATAANRPSPIKASESGTGFVKPKVKSPTKPIPLPSSLTAHTASSVSKGAVAPQQTLSRQTSSRQSLSRQSLHPPSQTTLTAATKTVKRQPSSISRNRPSLGPPPVKTTQEQPKKQKEVDEGFLARMMRPTQASSSKTHEKSPATPPRKREPRLSTSDTETSSFSAMKSPRTSTSVPARKLLVEKTGSSESAGGPKELLADPVSAQPSVAVKDEPEAIPQPEVADPIVEETAQVDTAEEVVELVHQAEQEEALGQTAKEESQVESLVQTEEVVPETANVETAEEEAAVAEDTDLIEIPVQSDVSVPEIKTEEPEVVEPAAEPEVEPEVELEVVPEVAVTKTDEAEKEIAEEEEDTVKDNAEKEHDASAEQTGLKIADAAEEVKPSEAEVAKDKEIVAESAEPTTEAITSTQEDTEETEFEPEVGHRTDEAEEASLKPVNGHAGKENAPESDAPAEEAS